MSSMAPGYALFDPIGDTAPEVYCNGVPMSSIVLWGDLVTETRLTGDWQAEWGLIRRPGHRLEKHPAFRRGAAVTVKVGPCHVFTGTLPEPDWDSGRLVAEGLCRQAETTLCLDAATGQVTTVPNAAVDYAIDRGAFAVERSADLGATALGSADGAADDFTYLDRLLDAATEQGTHQWHVDARARLVSLPKTPGTPKWLIAPDAGTLGASEAAAVDRVFVRYADSGAGGSLKTVFYPAVAPAGAIERGLSVVNRGAITAAAATGIAQSIWSQMQGKAGWTNGLTLTKGQVATSGGVAASLGVIRAGHTARLLGHPDPRATGLSTDVVIGDTRMDWSAQTVQVNPVGLAARTFEQAIEEAGGGEAL